MGSRRAAATAAGIAPATEEVADVGAHTDGTCSKSAPRPPEGGVSPDGSDLAQADRPLDGTEGAELVDHRRREARRSGPIHDPNEAERDRRDRVAGILAAR